MHKYNFWCSLCATHAIQRWSFVDTDCIWLLTTLLCHVGSGSMSLLWGSRWKNIYIPSLYTPLRITLSIRHITQGTVNNLHYKSVHDDIKSQWCCFVFSEGRNNLFHTILISILMCKGGQHNVKSRSYLWSVCFQSYNMAKAQPSELKGKMHKHLDVMNTKKRLFFKCIN